MRTVLWLGVLVVAAVAAAWFASHNAGSVAVFWGAYRVDVSLNLALLALAVLLVLVYAVLRAITGLLQLPEQAKRWRLQHQERVLATHWMDAFSHLMAGRFVRARKAAQTALVVEDAVARSAAALPYAQRLRVFSHLVAAESAHALQDSALRQHHLQQALEQAPLRDAQDTRDGVLLRAAQWALDDKDAAQAAQWLAQLPQGAARRTAALRLRFKVARLGGEPQQALELLRLLTKHRAFSEAAASSLAQALSLELLRSAHDTVQLQQAWDALDSAQQRSPEVTMHAAERWLALGGAVAQSRSWILPVWERMAQPAPDLPLAQRVRLVRILEKGLYASVEDSELQQPPTAGADSPLDPTWLARIDSAQRNSPHDPVLQYLAGVVCLRLGLWGKAQALLRQAQALLQDASLKRDAWRALATLALQRQDPAAAALAYRNALHEASALSR